MRAKGVGLLATFDLDFVMTGEREGAEPLAAFAALVPLPRER